MDSKAFDKYQYEYDAIGNNIRKTIFSDREYMRYLDEEWGIDLLGRAGT